MGFLPWINTDEFFKLFYMKRKDINYSPIVFHIIINSIYEKTFVYIIKGTLMNHIITSRAERRNAAIVKV